MSLLLALALAALATSLAVPPLARAAARLGLLDRPEARSVHAAPVARVGGIALALGFAAGLGVLAAVGGAAETAGPWAPYLLPAALYLGIGLLDDRRRLRPRTKFVLQAAAAACAVALGLRWQGTALGPFGALDFGTATPALTWLWLVAVVTAVNFLDGIDLITAATTAVLLGAAGGAGAGPGSGALYLLAGAAVGGFACWNRAPARAFPGDGATHLLGFLVASAALGVPGETSALPWAAASAPLLPGVLDVALGLVAKARRGVPLWRAHGQHLYQRLTRIGWSHARVALRYGVLALLALVDVEVVAPRAGLAAAAAAGALVLGLHLAHAVGRTGRLPYRW